MLVSGSNDASEFKQCSSPQSGQFGHSHLQCVLHVLMKGCGPRGCGWAVTGHQDGSLWEHLVKHPCEVLNNEL